MKSKAGIIIALLVIVAAGGFALSQNQSEDAMMADDMATGSEVATNQTEAMTDDMDMMDEMDNTEPPAPPVPTPEDTPTTETQATPVEAGILEAPADTAAPETVSSDPEPVAAAGPGMFADYSEDKLALADNGDVVLFFHASWCPSCRALNRNITENANDIPSDLAILELDYDRETELKKKYGVTTQHTLVQVDSAGNLINKWSGGSTLDSVVARLQ